MQPVIQKTETKVDSLVDKNLYIHVPVVVCVCVQIEFIDAGTPITNTHYIGAPKGEIYGADHGIARFNPELHATVRPQTPLKNLYLTGQCVL